MITFKRADNKVKIDFKFNDVYKRFKKTSELVKPYDITYSKWCQINEEINDSIIINMINTGNEVRVPHLGYFRVIKYKPNITLDENGELVLKTVPVNYKETLKLWEKLYPNMSSEEVSEIKNKPLVYLENKHTRGYRCKFKWKKGKCKVKNKTYYGFFTIRKYNRLLNTVLKDPNFKGDFYES